MPKEIRVTSALLCERVLRDQDGLLTAIRIADIVVISGGPTAFSEFCLLVMAKSDQMEQFDAEAKLELEYPSGSRITVGETKNWHFGSTESTDVARQSGSQLIISIRLLMKESGLHKFIVLADGREIVSLPLTVQIQPS